MRLGSGAEPNRGDGPEARAPGVGALGFRRLCRDWERCSSGEAAGDKRPHYAQAGRGHGT